MYKLFFEMKCGPFEITPDPTFFFPTPRHNEALANLSYGIRCRKGFVVLTGEVGTGKTLLLQCLLDLLKRVHIASAYISNPRLTPLEFLHHVAADLQISTRARDKSELLLDLNKYLIERGRRGSTTVLIVDEAHLLDWELLEEIRLLGNLETTKEKLLQIVLVGQPEFDLKLDSPHLRQLKQRVMLRCELKPLRQSEMRLYIDRRLSLAGGTPQKISFSERSVDLIYEYSAGIPRIVNTICENALITACAQRIRIINPPIVEEVASDFHLKRAITISEQAACRNEAYGSAVPAVASVS